ncbi:MAG TPA: hypothetical protein PK020_02235 [Ilumatobacteraceae bacterium]|nr:hypothetical protein [Ilumatobacteraceae bacterium]HRB03386.1 hypothetical protein [Ilumatobacteraceae bacterium]
MRFSRIVMMSVLVVCGACADTPATPVTSVAVSTAVSTTAAALPSGDGLPLLDQIVPAIAALETQLGGPQEYFEINATSRLVNLFVALNNAAVAQPWVYLHGALTSAEGQAASGGTFSSPSVDFDPDVILSTVLTELPGISIESFYIHGDGQGNVLYGVLATSDKGGGLDVVLGADGSVKSVDPVS